MKGQKLHSATNAKGIDCSTELYRKGLLAMRVLHWADVQYEKKLRGTFREVEYGFRAFRAWK